MAHREQSSWRIVRAVQGGDGEGLLPGEITMLSSSLRGMMVLTAAMVATAVQAQPTPYRHVDGWAKFPAGRPFGSMVSASVAPDGTLWVFERCGENTCAASNLAPVLAFDSSG